MKFEFHLVDGEIHKFSGDDTVYGAGYAAGYVLQNLAWIDYLIASPGTDKAEIIEVKSREPI